MSPSIYELKIVCLCCRVPLTLKRYRRHVSQHDGYSMRKIEADIRSIIELRRNNPGVALGVDVVNRASWRLSKVIGTTVGTDEAHGSRAGASGGRPTASVRTSIMRSGVTVTRRAVPVERPKVLRRYVEVPTQFMYHFNMQLNCPACQGTGGLDSSHGCWLCGSS